MSPQSGSIPSFSFVRIPAVKSFKMGSPSNERYRGVDENGANGHPVSVEITKAFMMMTTEVTQQQYFQVMGKNPSRFKWRGDCVNWDRVDKICPDHPVERVNWNEVQAFIKELNRLSGVRGCRGEPQDPSGCYRLPIEAEWEWAVRAGSETAYFFGKDVSQLGEICCILQELGRKDARPVRGNRLANRNGLYDVYGNVWEWVQDGYGGYLPGGRDPLVTTGSRRVIRGGGWHFNAKGLRSANRYGVSPSY